MNKRQLLSSSMSQLINKGKFRERANRTRKYQQSENHVAQLEKNNVYPKHQTEPVKKTPEPA